MKRPAGLAFGGLALVYLASAVSGWSSEGEAAIGMTAMSGLNTKAAAQLKRLLGGRDVVDIAGWAGKAVHQHPVLEQLRWQLYPEAAACAPEIPGPDDRTCPGNRCLVRAAEHFFLRLTGQSTENVPLELPGKLVLTDVDALKLLVTLIADIHEPLRAGVLEDFGGRNVTVKYATGAAAGDKRKTATLFEFWGTTVIDKVAAERPSAWFGGWTHVQSLGLAQNQLRREWLDAADKHLLFTKWAAESHNIACKSVYRDPRTQIVIPAEGFESYAGYEAFVLETVRTRILRAGARIAFVLDNIMARDASRLRRGSALNIAAEVIDFKKSGGAQKMDYLQHFFINLSIGFIVLGLLVYFGKFYAPASGFTTVRGRSENQSAPKRN